MPGTWGFKGFHELALEFPAGSEVEISPPGRARMRYDESLNELQVSLSGGAYMAFGNPSDIDIDDNDPDAFLVHEGANDYIHISTVNTAESVTLGNTTTNPALVFSGKSHTFNLLDNTATALTMTQGANPYITLSTLNGAEQIALAKDLLYGTTDVAFEARMPTMASQIYAKAVLVGTVQAGDDNIIQTDGFNVGKNGRIDGTRHAFYDQWESLYLSPTPLTERHWQYISASGLVSRRVLSSTVNLTNDVANIYISGITTFFDQTGLIQALTVQENGASAGIVDQKGAGGWMSVAYTSFFVLKDSVGAARATLWNTGTGAGSNLVALRASHASDGLEIRSLDDAAHFFCSNTLVTITAIDNSANGFRILGPDANEYMRVDTTNGSEKVLIATGPAGCDLVQGTSGGTIGFFGGAGTTKTTVSGSRANPEQALANLLTALANYGLITNTTTA